MRAETLPPDCTRLTIRSSRDRFAARLTRYRVPPRRAATRPGLTQVLGRRRTFSCKELFKASSITGRCTLPDRSPPSLRHNSNPLCLRLVKHLCVSAICQCASSHTNSPLHAPNYSFKPRPLRGLAHALSCTTTLGRCASRLNSGVRAQNEQCRQLKNGNFCL